MNKNLLLIVFVLFISIEAFTQVKSKKSIPPKSVKRQIIYPQKLPNSSVIKKPVPTTKVVSIDSNKVKKAPVKKDSLLKQSQKPILGPIISGPTSYTNEINQKELSKSGNTNKTINKAAKKEFKVKNWIKSNFEFGFKTGLTFSKINNFSDMVYSGVNIPDSKYKAGFTGGFFLNFKPLKKIQFQPEILFTQQGAKITEPMNRFYYTINFLTVPLLLKSNFGNGKLKYFVQAGPYFGYALSKKSVREIGGKLITEKIDFISDFNFFGEKDNRFDYGPVIGGGIQYKFKKTLIEFEARYQSGMANPIIYKTDKPVDLGDTGKNKFYTTSIAIYWPL